ncbi:hypothetical protein BCV70DRAFT_48997 [Testicularia cyperi]|uniref:Uncharacterized protein n=1 Tax=Testicularia cyperi TaxID=1882483 RepID=A0A317XHA6_9BASI|nr:hypothetical protein BCV70DRAFT_48997 [Testicularia cyperi]
MQTRSTSHQLIGTYNPSSRHLCTRCASLQNSSVLIRLSRSNIKRSSRFAKTGPVHLQQLGWKSAASTRYELGIGLPMPDQWEGSSPRNVRDSWAFLTRRSHIHAVIVCCNPPVSASGTGDEQKKYCVDDLERGQRTVAGWCWSPLFPSRGVPSRPRLKRDQPSASSGGGQPLRSISLTDRCLYPSDEDDV